MGTTWERHGNDMGTTWERTRQEVKFPEDAGTATIYYKGRSNVVQDVQ